MKPKFKFQKYLPPVIFDDDIIDAFVNEDFSYLHVRLGLGPWEMSPLHCHQRQAKPEQTPSDFADSPWRASWWKAMALREQLLLLAAEREE